MKTCKEIDEIIATKVMGATATKIDIHNMGAALSCQYTFPDGSTIMAYKWNPTTDMNQAMKCVRKMKASGWTFAMYNDWEVEIYRGHEHSILIEDKSLPLAICKAILKVKGIDHG